MRDMLRVDGGERHGDLGGLGVLGDVGQRLLDEPVDGELRRRAEVDMLELLDVATSLRCAELADQDLERSDQARLLSDDGPEVLDDPALEGDAAVQRLVKVGEALDDLRRRWSCRAATSAARRRAWRR